MGFIVSFNVGHGGSRTAEYLKKHLFNNLRSHPDFIRDTVSYWSVVGLASYLFYMCMVFSSIVIVVSPNEVLHCLSQLKL